MDPIEPDLISLMSDSIQKEIDKEILTYLTSMGKIPIKEYADALSWILQERGYTVGDKDNFEADITFNITDDLVNAIMIGSIRDDKEFCTVQSTTNPGEISVGGQRFNLADPNSCKAVGDRLVECINTKLPLPYHFFP